MEMVQEQPFASIKKTKTQEVVVKKCPARTRNNIECTKSTPPLGHRHLRAQRGIPVHVLNVRGQRGISVMQQSAVLDCSCPSFDLEIFVHGPVFKSSRALFEKPELWIGPGAAVFHPSA